MKKSIKLLLLTVLGTWMAGSAWAEEHYLVGGCTDSGWNAGSYHRIGVAMMKVNSDTWVWYGKLTTGEGDNGRFKIPNSIGGWDGYWAPAQGTVLTSEWSDLSTSGDGDYKFCVGEAGLYKVTINTSTKKIKAEKLGDGPQKDGDYYLIGSVADFCWFAAYIATNETNASKARLTDDLDFSTDGFFPLASDKHKFKGEIDGAGHTISGINVTEDYGFTALVRYAAGGAYIHDLVVEGSFSGGVKVAGVIGFARDGGEITLTNVINKANVKATGGSNGNEGNAAGLVACATDGTKVIATNCANMGEVRGQDGQCAAFIGWSQSGTKFTNCWNSGDIYNMENNCNLYRNTGSVTASNCWDASGNNAYTQGTKVAPATLATGEFCYTLNGNQSEINWYQNLTTGTVDAYPVPFSFNTHAQVYANGELQCDGITPVAGGTISFSNTSGNTIENHNFNEWGFCYNKPNGTDMCNELQTDFMTPNTDGYYEIGTKQKLNWFAVRVNGHDTYHSHTDGERDINGKLTADIDFSDQTNMIGGDGNSTAYTGTFDGQGHRVKVAYSVNQKNAALFRTISNAHIKNLITEGTINNLSSCSGGIFAGSHGASVVENCVSYVTFTRKEGDNSNGGDATIGGIGAYMHDTGKISNCAFYGSIETPNANGNGGLLGYANGGDNNKIEYCVVAATLSYTNEHLFARNTNSITSCYYVNTGKTYSNATEVTATQVASGELAYMLNGNSSDNVTWYQKLGTDADAQPLPFGDANSATVYANGSQYCDGAAKPGLTYENEDNGTTRDSHNYGIDWGLCTNEHDGIVCDDANPDFIALDNGYYPLSNKKELNWFALFVNQGKGDNANAKLTDDIDMSGITAFPGIGTNEHKYAGIFDGQKFRVSNLVMNINEDAVGFFRYVTSGGTVIKRFTIDNTCSFSGKAGVGAFVGQAQGRNGDRSLTLEELGNEAYVTASGANGAGIIGVDMGSDAIITMKNCYNTGAISSSGDGGALSGWLGDNPVVINCYNIGTITNGNGFARCNNGQGTLTNCYTNSNAENGGHSFKPDVNINDITDGTVFAALFDASNVWRMDFDATTAHPVLYEPATLVMKEDFPNRFVAGETADVKVYRAMTADDDWNTLCLPFNADASLFSAIAELTGVEGTTLKFETATAIEAGKAYLVKPAANITEITATGVELKAVTPTTVTGYAFTGIYEPTAIDEGDLFVAAYNKLTPADNSGNKLKGFRAYFDVTGTGARATSFVVDDTTTGIIGVDGTVIENGKIYNLNGQKVQNAQKGLYIVNGKKVVVK